MSWYMSNRIRSNVNIIPKSQSSETSRKKKKISLDDMLKYAKRAEEKFGEPILKDMELQGIIPNPFQDQIEDAVLNKVTSFSRKYDETFTRDFGKMYHEFRQQCWKKACAEYERDKFTYPVKNLRGVNFAPREDMLLWDKPKRTYMAMNRKVHLPRPMFNSMNYNAYEASQVYSGLAPGNVSLSEDWLQYNTQVELNYNKVYIDELEELKYIYKAFWYLTRINRQNWIQVLYEREYEKVIDYSLPTFTPVNGLNVHDGYVLLSVEGVDIYVTVERLFEWITEYREHNREYAIGECDNDLCVLFAIYLEDMGINKEIIKERLRPSDMEDVQAWLDLQIMGIAPSPDEEGYDDDDEAWKAMSKRVPAEVRSSEGPEIAYGDNTHEALFTMSNWKFDTEIQRLLDEEESDDEYPSDVEFEREYNSLEGGVDLPYEPGIHYSNEEFESWNLSKRDLNLKEKETEDDAESTTSENAPDQELSPIEKLGIDLVDPSRDTTYQPSARRIQLTWDPGGGSRSIPRRFNRLKGKGLRLGKLDRDQTS